MHQLHQIQEASSLVHKTFGISTYTRYCNSRLLHSHALDDFFFFSDIITWSLSIESNNMSSQTSSWDTRFKVSFISFIGIESDLRLRSGALNASTKGLKTPHHGIHRMQHSHIYVCMNVLILESTTTTTTTTTKYTPKEKTQNLNSN